MQDQTAWSLAIKSFNILANTSILGVTHLAITLFGYILNNSLKDEIAVRQPLPYPCKGTAAATMGEVKGISICQEELGIPEESGH